jgi:protein-L-isoaspartate(D-aspartate) O-methyltransferase
MLTAKLLQAAEIRASDSVLVVGCATGYAAAVAARLAAKVMATESDESLAAKARDILARLGLPGVTVKVAEAAAGNSADAPYDVILLNGATEVVPKAVCGQLKEGGRLLGVFAATRPPRATLVTRAHGDFGYRTLFDVSAPVLPGLERVPFSSASSAGSRARPDMPRVLKYHFKTEVWPRCCTSRVSTVQPCPGVP